MTIRNSKLTNFAQDSEEYNIPLDISDIINICKEYNKLGHQIQLQMDSILDIGVEQSLELGFLKKESLSHIKNFLEKIIENPYFGDACEQAQSCLFLIDEYCLQNKNSFVLN